MRRLLRWAFNFAAAVSAVLFVAAAGLWVRSYFAADSFEKVSARGRIASVASVSSSRGRLRVSWELEPAPAPPPPDGLLGYCAARPCTIQRREPDLFEPNVRADFNRAGLSWFRSEGGTAVTGEYRSGMVRQVVTQSFYPAWELILPHWPGVVLLALAPALRLMTLRRRLRRPGHCPQCGYDLRATPGRCPECGAAPGKSRATAPPAG